jgi:tRNA-guanine family transglycosylase
MFEYKLTAQDAKTKARTGEFKTPHGTLHTPSLAIVGTEGQIKGIPPGVTHTLPLNYSIVNTFHIWTKNIIEKIHDSPKKQVRSPKTVHEYGGFPGIVASDSGGFQVFSLGFGKTHKVGKLAKPDSSTVTSHDDDNPLIITEEGVTFRWNPSSSPTSGRDFDGASDEERTLTPELSMELQHQIGADIMFAFDECTSPFNSKEYVSKSVELTDRWLERCITKHKLLSCHSERSEESRINVNALDPSPDGYRDQDDKQIPMTKNPQALFAIVQGSEWQYSG